VDDDTAKFYFLEVNTRLQVSCCHTLFAACCVGHRVKHMTYM